MWAARVDFSISRKDVQKCQEENFEMAYGGLETFYGGLERLIWAMGVITYDLACCGFPFMVVGTTTGLKNVKKDIRQPPLLACRNKLSFTFQLASFSLVSFIFHLSLCD